MLHSENLSCFVLFCFVLRVFRWELLILGKTETNQSFHVWCYVKLQTLGTMASEQKVPWLCGHKANLLTEEEICECLDPQ